MTASTTTDTATASIREHTMPAPIGGWRSLPAAPLPWAAMCLVNLLQPFAGDEDWIYGGKGPRQPRSGAGHQLDPSILRLPDPIGARGGRGDPASCTTTGGLGRHAWWSVSAWASAASVARPPLAVTIIQGSTSLRPGSTRVLDRAARTGRRPLLGHRVDHRTGPARPRPVAQPRRGRDLRSPCCSAGSTRSFQEVTSRSASGFSWRPSVAQEPAWHSSGLPTTISICRQCRRGHVEPRSTFPCL